MKTMKRFPKWYLLLAAPVIFTVLVTISLLSQSRTPGSDTDDIFTEAGYRNKLEKRTRTLRFPSVSERVKLYMSNWYLPPCNDDNKIHWSMLKLKRDGPDFMVQEGLVEGETKEQRSFLLDDRPQLGPYPFYLQRQKMVECDGPISLIDFCNNTLDYILPVVEALEEEGNFVPTLLEFGDSEMSRAFSYPPREELVGNMYPAIPFIRKFRRSMDRQERDLLTAGKCVKGARPSAWSYDRLEPVVWLLSEQRHFGMLSETRHLDTPWSEKIDAVVYRGGLTGTHRDYTKAQLEAMAREERCYAIERCRLILHTADSSLVNAKLVYDYQKEIPKKVNGVKLFGDRLSYADQMQYKAIIMLEGNDVSSGLKWALLSHSVVMMPPPKYTSWVMEELLEPWVHYVPLKEDLSDVEDKMQWILDNDEKAEEIGRRGSLWMLDLVFHPNVLEDNQRIFEEMMRRYRAHF